ncbi:MAG: ADOP family duplicated permease [Actinomycetota bacterium]
MLARIRSLIRNFLHRKQVERELDAELNSFVEEQTLRKMAQGVAPEEAVRQAKAESGGITQVKEQVRGARAGFWLETFWNDLRHGARSLRKNPGFALACVLTFALGISANTAIFSMVNAFVFRPVHAQKPEQLTYFVAHQNLSWSNGFSYPNFMEIRRESHDVFSDIAGVHEFQMEGMNSQGKSRNMWVDYVTTNFFSVMGVKPEMGSFFAPDDKLVGHDQAIVLTHSFWKSQFNGDPSVVGKKIAIDGQPLTIAGVTPEGFTGTTTMIGVHGFLPMGIAEQLKNQEMRDMLERPERLAVLMIGRLRDRADLGKANTTMAVISQRLAAEDPKYNKDIFIRTVKLGIGVTNSTGENPLPTVSALFLTLAGLVLVLAGANVANLLLARAVVRSREMAMRTALGAARGRLIRQVMTETLLLAMLGCAGGIALGAAVSAWVGSMHLGVGDGLPITLNFSMDWRVYSYAFAAALLVAVVGGVTPAWRASGVDVRDVLREGGAQTSPRRQRFRTILVSGQVAVSLTLLVVAGLFVRSLWHAQHADLGFDPHNVMNFSMDPHGAGYEEARGRHFYKDLLQRVNALPGVESASLTNAVPLGEEVFGSELEIEGVKKGKTRPEAYYSGITADFLKTMRIGLLRGRMFTAADDAASQRVAIVNQRMAEKLWPGQEPIGKRFKRLDDPDTSHVVEVVGVARNAQIDDILGQDTLHYFIPLAQDYKSKQTLQLRTAGDPAALARPVVEIIHQMDAAMPVYDVTTMETVLNGINGLFLFRLGAGLATLLGGLGLVLAVIGVYGVISYSTAQRTREIGIRMALGAQRNQIVSGILKQGLVILAIGIALGGLAAGGIGQVAGSFLVGVSALDPLTYICVSVLLAAIALTATLIPALRATKVDPMMALRCD